MGDGNYRWHQKCMLFNIIFLVGFVLVSYIFCPAETKNLLSNPGFEIDTDKNNIPDGWRFYNSRSKEDKSEAIGTLDNSTFHSGSYSVKIEKINEKVYSSWITDISAEPITKYKISLWYKTKNFHDYSAIGIYCQNEAKNTTATYSFPLPGTEEWKFFEKEFDAVNDTRFLQIQLRVCGSGITWYDDVSLEEVGPAKIPQVSIQKGLIKIQSEKLEELKSQAIYIGEEINIGHQKEISDLTARNGSCIRIDGDAPPYFATSWEWDINKIIPGFKYTLYGVIKVNKKGEEGSAFRIGVYDSKNQRYVVSDMRPLAKEVGNMIWELYQIGTFEFQKGQFVYVGPTKNVTNIPEIFVDYFLVLPGDEHCKNFWKDAGKNNTTKFYLTIEKQGAIGLKLKEKKLEIGYLVTDDKREWEESFIGFVLDYHTEEGYTKKVLLSTGICGSKVITGEKIELGYSKNSIDEVIKLFSKEELGQYKKINIDLTKYAPVGWDGETWITVVVKDSFATFSGQIIEPDREKLNILEYRILKGKNDIVSFDIESLNYFKEKIKTNFFKSGIEKLKSIQ